MSIPIDRLKSIAKELRPYANTSAPILSALSNHADSQIDIDTAIRKSRVGPHQNQNATKVIQILNAWGVIKLNHHDARVLWAANDLSNLSFVVEGLNVAEEMERLEPKSRLVVTLPPQSGYIAQVLPEQGIEYVKIEETTDAFVEVAAAAKQRLAIITPFIDRAGLEWVSVLFNEASEDSVEKILIVRNYSDFVSCCQNNRDIQIPPSVRVFDYRKDIHECPNGISYETFHAKIVLADSDIAYVGSANMLESSVSFALEAGVIVEKEASASVGLLVDAILLVSDEKT
ncbi:MAG: phospholipase D-like domain-containing protein [Magnetovibrio sp.]|nr:phospholipase D-like domain-containing protein [Magnetovibrio sp.]